MLADTRTQRREDGVPKTGMEGAAPTEGGTDLELDDNDDDDAQYWPEDDEYDARGVFTIEEEPSFDIHDYI